MIHGLAHTIHSASARAWTPSALADLSLWLKADDASTISLNAGNVSQWSDKEGTGNHASQGTASKQPYFAPDLQNGKHGVVMDYDATHRYLSVSGAADINDLFKAGGYFALALRLDSFTSADFHGLFYKRSAGYGWYFYVISPYEGYCKPTFKHEFSATGGLWDKGRVFPIGQTIILELFYDASSPGTAPVIVLDGAESNMGQVTAPVGAYQDETASLYMGSYGGGRGWEGPFFEVIMSKSIPDAGTRSKVRDYLNTEWSVY